MPGHVQLPQDNRGNVEEAYKSVSSDQGIIYCLLLQLCAQFLGLKLVIPQFSAIEKGAKTAEFTCSLPACA